MAQENESALCLKPPKICICSQYDEIRVDGMQRLFQILHTPLLNIYANLFPKSMLQTNPLGRFVLMFSYALYTCRSVDRWKKY